MGISSSDKPVQQRDFVLLRLFSDTIVNGAGRMYGNLLHRVNKLPRDRAQR